MTIPILVERNGHRTWLKWHRGRRRASDAEFTGARIIEGMAHGASVEVDLVVHADHGMAVLHDLVLDRSTTGSGRVAETPAAVLRDLQLRDNAGEPLPDRVMLLEDLAAHLAANTPHPDALLQLDFKEDATVLSAAVRDAFGTAIGPVAQNFILSSGDAVAVAMLAAAAPGIHIGYDPCHGDALEQLALSRNYAGFVATAIAASPAAEMIYLAYELVLGASDDGFDLVAAFHAADRRIDAYTIRAADADGVAAAGRLLDLKVDQITTDDPEALLEALSR